jgi:hypothetical protein
MQLSKPPRGKWKPERTCTVVVRFSYPDDAGESTSVSTTVYDAHPKEVINLLKREVKAQEVRQSAGK